MTKIAVLLLLLLSPHQDTPHPSCPVIPTPIVQQGDDATFTLSDGTEEKVIDDPEQGFTWHDNNDQADITYFGPHTYKTKSDRQYYRFSTSKQFVCNTTHSFTKPEVFAVVCMKVK